MEQTKPSLMELRSSSRVLAGSARRLACRQPIEGVITYEVFDALPVVLGLAAVATTSAVSQVAQVANQVMRSIMLNTLAPIG
jgi:hypothetical protein